VKEEIYKIVVELQNEQKDETAHRDNGIESSNTNMFEMIVRYDKKESLETKMADMDEIIEVHGENIESSTVFHPGHCRNASVDEVPIRDSGG